jgi:hypothetical protein
MKYTYLLALAGVAVAASTGFSQTPVSIVNPTFNSPTAPSPYLGISGAAGTNTLTGWTVSAGSRIIDLQHPASATTTAASGQDASQYVEDFEWSNQGWTGVTTISQVLTTSFVAGTSYSLTADATFLNAANAEVGDTFFIANSSGTVLASTTITGLTSNVWSQFTVPLVSTGLFGDTGAIEIGFSSPNTQTAGQQNFMEIDNFALTATAAPEPSSIAIAALGGFGLLGLVRRRRA